MSSLHAGGGLLLLKHQVASAPSVVCPLISGASRTTIITAFGTSSASGVVPHFAGLKSVKAVSSFSGPSLKSLPGSGRVGSPSSSGGKVAIMPRNWLRKLGFGGSNRAAQTDPYNSPAHGPDDDKPALGLQFATFGAGCFWGPELAFQRVTGVSKTEVGYTQGLLHNPSYGDVCEGDTGHNEVVRVQYDPMKCKYENLLDAFWARHDPTTLNRQGGDVGTQYRTGIYYYNSEQEKAARESLEAQQAKLSKKIVTEILPAKKFYRAEEYHQQYLAKGGRFGFRQSAEKGCNDPIRCYG